MNTNILRICTFLTLISASLSALNPLVVKGNLFFDATTGNQFWFKGVDYQPRASDNSLYDPLADKTTIDRDLPYLKALGINSIRVYQTDATLNHDYAMQQLDAAGIYLILDIAEPLASINSDDPTWDLDLYTKFAAKVDAFLPYGNLGALIVSNEVSNQVSNTPAAAYVKAAGRDIKSYLKARGSKIPVGYAIADAGTIGAPQEAYFGCGDAPSDLDFYGINIYRWCGDSNYHLSGYDVLTQNFTNWPIAVLFSEYGCNQVEPRPFTEVGALYGSNMTSVFSGGLAFEYSNGPNNFGLVNLNGTNTTVFPLTDYNNLKNELAMANPTSTVTLSNYTPTPKVVDCPAVDPANWLAASSPLPPVVDGPYCACALNSYKCRINATTSAQLVGVAEVANIYAFVCGKSASYCTAIAKNATSGVYGALSMCDAVTRVSSVMNAYYLAQSDPSTACGYNGFGLTVASPTTTISSCQTGQATATSAFTRDTTNSNIPTSSTNSGSSTTAATSSQTKSVSATVSVSATAGSGSVTYTVSQSATGSVSGSASASGSVTGSASTTEEKSSAAIIAASSLAVLALLF